MPSILFHILGLPVSLSLSHVLSVSLSLCSLSPSPSLFSFLSFSLFLSLCFRISLSLSLSLTSLLVSLLCSPMFPRARERVLVHAFFLTHTREAQSEANLLHTSEFLRKTTIQKLLKTPPPFDKFRSSGKEEDMTGLSMLTKLSNVDEGHHKS